MLSVKRMVYLSGRSVAEFAATGVILPPKDDLSALQAEQTMVGDRYAMGVSGQIMKHMLWSTEGRLGIDQPILAKQRARTAAKPSFEASACRHPGEGELPGSESAFQSGDERFLGSAFLSFKVAS